ncbi:MAG: aminotransferase class V-fold PLP-dependent enzyme, partial [Eubacterium sp.]|nr:aminotransferase class V-fold PLP-dependent enzyme [Eubacterium sp.]
MNLYKTLQEHRDQGPYPMHMPGHKRSPYFHMDNPYGLDVTEVEGLDNLHQPEGVIRDLEAQISKIYQSLESYLLVNGSTCGILAAISAACQRGDKILVGRNCHRSVYHAIYLMGLRPVYLLPEMDEETGIGLGISPKKVRGALEQDPDVACIFLTSPTYEGVVSDIKSISDLAHERGIPLLVDQAHGAHFPWMSQMESAGSLGADMVVESLHKTLPSLTQTALLHTYSRRVEADRIRRYLDIYQTSSPSYVLMASVALCMDYLEEKGGEDFALYEKNLEDFREGAKEWSHLRLWTREDMDPSKLVIYT